MLSESVARAVTQVGQINIQVDGSEFGPPYMYTVGLEKSCQHPELIIFGLDPAPSDYLLTKIIEKIKGGECIWSAGQTHLLHGVGRLPLAIREAHRSKVAGYVEEAWLYYGRETQGSHVRYLQVVWPDAAGLFPWDAGFDEEAREYQTVAWD
jgi:hypothetical protein